MTRNILLLSERDFLALPIIRSLNPNEFRAYVLGPADSTVRFSRFCARYFSYPGDGTGTDYAESINATCQKFGIEAVIPLDLPTTVRLSDHRHRICVPTLPVADSATLLRLHDKWQFAKTLDRLGIPYPETVMVERRDSLVDGILPYPFMVKPLDLEAGRGIVKISDSADLRGYLDSAA
jgi:predicted ATP-grasp superfamily ATP-dependent carboligase